MSLSDAERDALEQLQDAIENGDLSLLRKLLNQTDLGASRGARAQTFWAGHLQLRVLRALQEATRRDPRRVAREYVYTACFSASGDT